MRVRKAFFPALALGAWACGGSSSSDQSQDPAVLIQNACDNVVGLHCSSLPPEQCPGQMNEARDEAVAKGCGSAFDSVLVCYANKLADCEQDPKYVCATQFDALDACEYPAGGEDCGQGSGGGPPNAPPYYQSCGASCTSWAVDCEALTSPTVVCTCTAGPNSGTTFDLTDCSELTIDLGAQYCKG